MDVASFLLFLLLTFLVAGIPFGLLYVKIFKNKDVRTVGSGNIGATNVLRAAGPGTALLTAISDILKSFIPALLAKKYFTNPLFPYLVWLSAILGHCFSPYLKFRGGKGVATFFGGLLALQPTTALITFGVWFVTIASTRFVSLGSIIASLAPLVVSILGKAETETLIILGIIPAIVIYRHKDNINRLIHKREHKLRLKE